VEFASWPPRGVAPDGQALPVLRRVVWDVDVSSLDADRVPTGNPAALGVWYCGS
jgi:hypothetical protein